MLCIKRKGWGKKHSVVDYVFKHNPCDLIAYHYLIMDEMAERGFKVDLDWRNPYYRGKVIGIDNKFTDADFVDDDYCYAIHKRGLIFDEHNATYLKECIDLLKKKEAPIEWSKVNV